MRHSADRFNKPWKCTICHFATNLKWTLKAHFMNTHKQTKEQADQLTEIVRLTVLQETGKEPGPTPSMGADWKEPGPTPSPGADWKEPGPTPSLRADWKEPKLTPSLGADWKEPGPTPHSGQTEKNLGRLSLWGQIRSTCAGITDSLCDFKQDNTFSTPFSLLSPYVYTFSGVY